MKKRIVSILLLVVLISCLSATAFADGYTGYARLNTSGKMESSFDSKALQANMEPGDTAQFTVSIQNAYADPTRWYMSNEVLDSLEETIKRVAYSTVKGGAYSYTLTYRGPDGTITIVDKGRVGGDEGFSGRIGLREATNSLESWFFLDTLNQGESGTVTLTVGLEGETIGNVYQNTQADIKMNFAVELPNKKWIPVKTGDENNLLPYYIVMIVAGLVFLYLALDSVTDRMYRKRGRG